MELPTPESLAADPKHLEMAFRIAAEFAKRFPPLADEFESECLVGLCEAANSFDPDRGTKFVTHATNRIRGCLLDVQRNWTPQGFRRKATLAPSVGSIDALVAGDDRPTTFAETLASGDEPVGWEEEYQDELRGYSRRAGKGSGAAIVGYYGHAATATMKRVGEALGLSEGRISQMHSAAAADLAERFGSSTPGGVFMRGTARFSREELLKGVTMGGHDYDEERTADGHISNGHTSDGHTSDGTATEDAAEETHSESPLVNRSCRQCGQPYGKTRRCYTCHPGRMRDAERRRRVAAKQAEAKARTATGAGGPPDAAPTVVAVPAQGPRALPPPSPLMAEIDAARAIAGALGGLDAASARRVLAWVAGHFGSEGRMA